jgi:hypothetical protein
LKVAITKQPSPSLIPFLATEKVGFVGARDKLAATARKHHLEFAVFMLVDDRFDRKIFRVLRDVSRGGPLFADRVRTLGPQRGQHHENGQNPEYVLHDQSSNSSV